MAAFFRHGAWKLFTKKNVFPKYYATKAEKKKGIDRKPIPKIEATAESLAAKGFLRPQKPYSPPEDLEASLYTIFQNVLKTQALDTKVMDLNDRFKLFSACAEKIGHSIPSSLLHQIESLEDVYKFYATPVDTRTPLDSLRNEQLPENLHIQFDYHRWHPETDTMFRGKTAFPESSTLVTGLKYKEKYKGHKQNIKHPEL
ncbi:hypothetical protein ABEB36_008891 [Hypothenemus hampei]|uniref:Large ribosomal subunit protein mL50 n=1 Tax=Hypothenemus hampei TaxID=57062 RepID=A0ABD1ENH4_HYPHA